MVFWCWYLKRFSVVVVVGRGFDVGTRRRIILIVIMGELCGCEYVVFVVKY